MKPTTLKTSSPASNDDAVESDKRPLLEHLIEFRRRLMIASAAFLAATALCYMFAPEIYAFLVRPLADSFPDPAGRQMIYTGLVEAFFTYLKLAMFGGVFIAFPVIAAQVYYFVAPGLYKRERIVIVPYLAAAPLLFLLGAALCYYGIMPVAWKFFLSFENSGLAGGLPIRLEARVGEYLSLVMHLIMAFGLSFQLPVALALLTQAGLLSPATLARRRRYAVVLITIASAILTPPDALSMVSLAVPLYLLYEASILACRAIERKKHARH